MDSQALYECSLNLLNEANELYLDKEVRVLDEAPSPLQFYRDYVAPNKPVIIKGAISHWPAMTKWTNDYLRQKIGDEEVTVTVTPSGYADAVTEGKFVMGEDRHMKFASFLDIIEKKTKAIGKFYVQKQNSNFTEEFQTLMEDAEDHFPLATEAMGKRPDAVNFWMGEETAISSMHKDNYENLYCVVAGTKTFTLLPPVAQPFVPYRQYQAANYKENEDGVFEIIEDKETGMVPWIPVDPLDPDLELFPEFAEVTPLTVKVKAGETLYLPSLWFHHVQQSRGAIAVNFWYDMEFDIKYNYFKFVEELIKKRSTSGFLRDTYS